MAPLLGAGLIAASRYEDYRHDVYDVVSGSFLGTLIMYFSYRRYYPSLRSPNCEVPFSDSEAMTDGGSNRKRGGAGRGTTAADMAEEDEVIPLNELQHEADRDLERGVA